jgi:two-component system, NarL family, nitrate/nitrite response regulator NarL
MLNDSSAAESGGSTQRHLWRMFLIEPQTIVRAAIRTMIEADDRFRVVGEAATFGHGLEQIRLLQPEMVLTDLSCDRPNEPLVSELRACAPRMAILVLTDRWNPQRVAKLMRAGVRAFVLKQCGRAELFAAMNEVCAGGTYVCAGRPTAYLTERQREVLRGIALGRCNSEIALSLGVSVKTIQKHRDQIRHVLNLRNTAALTAYAIREGFVSG